MLGDAVSRMWIAALVGVVVVGGVACGGDDDEEARESTDPTASSTTAAPTTTTTDPSAEVEAAYLGYWDAYLKAVAQPVNPELPELQQRVTGAQRTIVTRNLQQLQTRGEAVRLRRPSHYRHVVRTIERSSGSASVEACVYDDLITYDVGTGVTVDESVAWKEVHAELVHQQGMWLISYLEIARGTGGGPCATT
jgi:hypothetical protein